MDRTGTTGPVDAPGGRADRPFFSIVTPVYNVEPYLAEYIASIEAQAFDLRRVEVIAVDDGSTDGSPALLDAWAERRPGLVRVVTRENGGSAAARQTGLEHATGTWITFTDPDDILRPEFLAVAHRFANAHPEATAMAGRPILFDETRGRITDTDPRRHLYTGGNRLVDLGREPNVFPGVCAATFVHGDRLRAAGTRFDPRIQPNFEDAHFVASYLLAHEHPTVGMLTDAVYVYRKRRTQDSALQRALANPGRYENVPRFGLLDILEQGGRRYGRPPAWVQNLVIYELSWYLSADEEAHSQVRIEEAAVPGFHELLGRILRLIDPAVVAQHTARPLKTVWADVIAHACRDQAWSSEVAARTSMDAVLGLQRITWRYTGAGPEPVYRVDGQVVEPSFGKTMAHRYYGRTLMQERIAWLPAGSTTEVTLDGRLLEVVDEPRGHRAGSGRPGRAARHASTTGSVAPRRRPGVMGRIRHVVTGAARSVARSGSWLARRGRRTVIRSIASMPPYRDRYRDAWLLMDRVHNADDNGERLFEHLRIERSDVNAWFVIDRQAADWDRLRASHGSRVIAYGSFAWTMLLLNAAWVVSSHCDRAMVRPPGMMDLVAEPTWRFAFLQHGVTKDDLSPWLNKIDMQLFVVSTTAELASVVDDGTSYVFTAKETRNTGLPRFDRLLAKGRAVPVEQRDMVLVAPTWRSYLTLPGDPREQTRPIKEAFWTSEYQASWLALLGDDRIARAAAARGWTIGFMPHPNFQEVLAQIPLPDHVRAIGFTGTDVQGLYARTGLLVTDYSSVAFNAAYLDIPLVYFQFDRYDVLGGGHLGRKGYFEYERDGYGPVAVDIDAAVAAVVASIERGPVPEPEYTARVAAAFPVRDGRACSRVVEAIEELSRPWLPAG